MAKAGIELERIDPGQPQQNGRHERMHRTLKTETAKPPAASAAAQQARFDRFREEFNAVRPHEALGQAPPATVYRRSPRAWREPEEPVYDAGHAARRVRRNGCIKCAETSIARFAGIDLGLFDRQSRKLIRFRAARPAARIQPMNRLLKPL